MLRPFRISSAGRHLHRRQMTVQVIVIDHAESQLETNHAGPCRPSKTCCLHLPFGVVLINLVGMRSRTEAQLDAVANVAYL